MRASKQGTDSRIMYEGYVQKLNERHDINNESISDPWGQKDRKRREDAYSRRCECGPEDGGILIQQAIVRLNTTNTSSYSHIDAKSQMERHVSRRNQIRLKHPGDPQKLLDNPVELDAFEDYLHDFDSKHGGRSRLDMDGIKQHLRKLQGEYDIKGLVDMVEASTFPKQYDENAWSAIKNALTTPGGLDEPEPEEDGKDDKFSARMSSIKKF